LTSNAIKFSREGQTIQISSDVTKSTVNISVQDNGMGISIEDQKHLYERFFRGRNATHIQGTGLGLHIVAKYIELMNGTINCQSEEYNGTKFSLSFPQ
jgi:signal transduction histidine kinase